MKDIVFIVFYLKLPQKQDVLIAHALSDMVLLLVQDIVYDSRHMRP